MLPKQRSASLPHIFCLGWILILLAALKIPAAFTVHSQITELPWEPMLEQFVALLELTLGIIALRSTPTTPIAYCAILLGGGFIAYRFWRSVVIPFSEPCGCLGIARSWGGVLKYYEENALIALAVYIFLSGLWTLFLIHPGPTSHQQHFE